MEKSPSGTGYSAVEKLRAKGLLLKMRRLERVTEPAPEGSTVEVLRRKNRERYRDWVGVDVENRDKLRSALEDIVNGTRATVAEVITAINAGTFNRTVNPAGDQPEADLNEWL